MAVSCVHFPMYGLKTRAAQPLKTGDNICPPSLSVLPSMMVRPFSPLQLFTPPFSHPLLPSFFPPPPHLLFYQASRSQVIWNAAAPFFCFPLCSLICHHFAFFEKTYSAPPPYTFLFVFIWIRCCFPFIYKSFVLNSFLSMISLPFCMPDSS